jgi:hypothetical protein
MKENTKLGTILAAIGILVGLASLYIFATSYNFLIDVEINAGRPDEANVVRLVFPLLSYIGTAATALWAVSLYGFIHKEKWAWMLGIIAGTLHILAGFFPTIPAMSRGETPVMMVLFFPSLLLWFGLMFVRKVNWKIVSLAFAAGLAMVLSFMDGVATIDKVQLSALAMKGEPLFPIAQLPVGQDILNGMYIMVQQVNWWGSLAWAAFIFALLARKSWALPLGIFAGVMALIGGLPLTVSNILEVQRFSMFAPSPGLSALLIVTLLLPGTRKLISAWSGPQSGNHSKQDEHPQMEAVGSQA